MKNLTITVFQIAERIAAAHRCDNRLTRDIVREGAASTAVLAIDIDRFKYINDIYGLEAGNKVLQQVAESLSVSVSKGDMVCRLGSDEFGMMLHDIDRHVFSDNAFHIIGEIPL
jgi:diguanylate cyclase (GGDEF)-like protein